MSSLGLASILMLVAGACIVFAIDWQKRRRITLLRQLEKLPEPERLSAVEHERGAPGIRLPAGQTPSQYVTLQIRRREIIQIGLSLVLLLASLFVILSKLYEPGEKHWAYGIIGTLIGFWLKPVPSRSS